MLYVTIGRHQQRRRDNAVKLRTDSLQFWVAH